MSETCTVAAWEAILGLLLDGGLSTGVSSSGVPVDHLVRPSSSWIRTQQCFHQYSQFTGLRLEIKSSGLEYKIVVLYC